MVQLDELAVQVADIDARAKSNTKRIDKLERDNDALNSMATSIAVMAERQEIMSKQVDTIDKKVTCLEQLPAKRWNGIVDKIILALVSLVLGYLFSLLIR